MSVPDVWLCAVDGQCRLVVACDAFALTAFEVRQVAAAKLAADPHAIAASRLDGDSEPANIERVEIRWTGSDYRHGGTPDRRRMQERVGDGWVDL